jgi:MtN3 and saliva related transmembrane protein
VGLVDVVGLTAAACSMASFTPQLIKIWRERDASSVSLRMYAITVTGFSLWIAYGVLLKSWPVMIANTVCLIESAAILALKWRFERASAATR